MAREYIESEDLLNTGRKKLNRSIDKSYDAEETSVQALKDANKLGNEAKQISTEKGNESIAIAKENEKIANEANLIAKETNERVIEIIGGETDSAEIIDSRKPISEDPFPTLGERLNASDKVIQSKNNQSDLTINSFSKNVSSNLKLVEIKNEEIRIFSRSFSKNDYVMFRLSKGTGDTSEASYGQNFDLLRLDNVHSYKDLLCFNQPKNFVSSKLKDGLTDDFKLTNFITGYTTPLNMDYISNTGKEAQSSYLEFDVEITRANNGRLDLGFYGTPNTNTNLNILVNGKIVDNIDTTSDIAKTVFRSVNIGSVIGIATIRLQVANDSTASRAVHFLGYNATDFKYVDNKSNINGYLANLNTGKHYISKTTGANEYAVLDNSNKKWFGSFHGGEVLISRQILADGVEVNLKEYGLFEAKNIVIVQKTKLIDKVEAHTITEFSDDGTFMFQAHFEVLENIEVSNFYTCMTCSNDEFKDTIYPKLTKVGSPSNTIIFEKTGKLIQMNPVTKQTITTEYVPQLKYYTDKALRILWFNNLYSKVYHAQTIDNPIKLENIDFGNKKIFD